MIFDGAWQNLASDIPHTITQVFIPGVSRDQSRPEEEEDEEYFLRAVLKSNCESAVMYGAYHANVSHFRHYPGANRLYFVIDQHMGPQSWMVQSIQEASATCPGQNLDIYVVCPPDMRTVLSQTTPRNCQEACLLYTSDAADE